MTTLSVVIPTYNRGKLALRAIDSALGQDARPTEVIVVDDGSADDTPALLRDYPGIRYLRQPNAGLSAARNAGIQAAVGEWIAFLDDDDIFLPGKLAQDMAVIAAQPQADLVYGNARRVSPEGADLGLCLRNHRPPGDPLRALLTENFVLVQTVTARRQAVLDAGLFDPAVRLCEDVDLWVRMAARGARFQYAADPRTAILRMPGTMSGDPIRMQEALLDVGRRHAGVIRAALGGAGGDWWAAGPHYRLGRTWYDRGAWEPARQHLRAALAADPGHRGARLYLSLTRLGPAGRWPLTAARGLKRAVMALLGRAGWVEGRW